MSQTGQLVETIIDYVDQSVYKTTIGFSSGNKLVLGGASGVDGGSGVPWGGFAGQLIQRRVTFDTTEKAEMCLLPSASLLDNLNRMRYHGLPARQFEASPTLPRGMKLTIGSGIWYHEENEYVDFNVGDSPTITSPITNPRIDVIYVTQSGTVDVQQGTESASPTITMPTASGVLPVAAIYIPVGASAIGWQCESYPYSGYIYKDMRPFMSYPGGGEGGGVTDAQYVTLVADPTLTDERVLTAGAHISIADNGAGSTVVVACTPTTIDHGDLLGLADDDHTQYVHTTINRNIAAVHTFVNGLILASGTPGDTLGAIRWNGTDFLGYTASGWTSLTQGGGVGGGYWSDGATYLYPTNTRSIQLVDDQWIGLGAAKGRIEFDDQAIDEINFLSCNIGVGTSSPNAKLHIYDAVGSSAAKDIIIGSTIAGFPNDVAKLQVQRGGSLGQGWNFIVNTDAAGTETEAMRITSESKVGIGTANPDFSLDVGHKVGGIIGTCSIRAVVIDGKVGGSTAYDVLYLQYSATGKGVQIGDAGTDHSLIVFGSGTFYGNVGIGVSPSDKLHLKSAASAHCNIRIDTTTAGYDAAVMFYEAGVQKWVIRNDGDDSDRLKWSTSALSCMYLETSGHLHITSTCYANKFTDGGGGYDFFMPNPANPKNEMLRHWAVETDGMRTIYGGNAKTNEKGIAVVVLPDWFEFLNSVGDAVISLTSFNGMSLLSVDGGISNSRFTVVSEKTKQEFSWIVMVHRGDMIAREIIKTHPIVEPRTKEHVSKYWDIYN